MLQPADIAIQFAGGVDTKTDAKAVAVTKLTDLQNAVFLKNGTLSKRNGYQALAKPWTTGDALGKRQDELIAFADAKAWSYRSASGTWSEIGAVSSIVASATPAARTGTDQTEPDTASNGGVTVAAWEDSEGGVWGAILDATSGRQLVGATQLDASGSRPRCVAVGNVLHVLWVNGVNLKLSIVNPASAGFSAAFLLTQDMDSSGAYDAVATLDTYDATNKPALLAWAVSGGYRVGYIHSSGVLGTPVVGLPSPAQYSAAHGGSVGPIACAFWSGGGTARALVSYGANDSGGTPNQLEYRIVDATAFATSIDTGTFATSTGAIQRAAVEYASSATVWWAAEKTGATADVHQIITGSYDTAAKSVTAGTTIRGHTLASRAWADDGDVYVALVHPVLYFPYVAVCQISGSMRAQARLLPGLSSGILTRSVLPSVWPVSPTAADGTNPPSALSRQHALALGYRIQLSGTSGTQFGEQGIQLFTLDYDHADAYRNTELGLNMYLAGAMIQSYDGRRFAEHNFHCAPDTASGTITTSQGTGGSLTTAQWYGYKLCYEEIDAQGELHPGPVSIGTLVNLTGSNDQVTLTIPTYRLTSKNRVRIGVFRSLAAATAPTDPEAIEYFRVSSVDPTATGANGYVLNDSTVDSVSFTDNLADATIATLEPLYTNGGILSNDPEQSGGEAIVGGKTRLFWLDPLDANVVNYSQQLRDDTSAELSAFLSQRLDPLGGDIVALAVMDDNVIVFKERAIFAFGGVGPNADGSSDAGAGWTAPGLVTSDVGCSSPSSVANVPVGIVFQSDKGIHLLDRSLQVQRIGDDVYTYNSQHVSRATLLPDRPHVVFLTDKDQGRTLLFDYDRGQWSTFTNHSGHDAQVVGGDYYYLGIDGYVYEETPGIYKDGTRHIPMVIETAWIKLAGILQGWQKVHRATMLGNYLSPHTLRMFFRLDYEPAWSGPYDHVMDSDQSPSNYGAGNYGAGTYQPIVGLQSVVYQREYHMNKRCQAIAFHFEDVESSADYGACFELSEVLLTGGIVGRRFRPGPARQG